MSYHGHIIVYCIEKCVLFVTKECTASHSITKQVEKYRERKRLVLLRNEPAVSADIMFIKFWF